MDAARPPRFSLRQQTEGAMLAVVATIMSLATYLPLAGAFFMLAAPAAIALATIRHGLRLGLTVALLGTVLLLILAGPYESLFFVTTSAGFGVIIGALVRLELRPGLLFVAGILAVSGLQAASIELGGRLTGIGGFATMKTEVQTAIVQAREWIGKTPGVNVDMTQFQLLEQLIDPLFSVPIILVLMAGFTGFLVHYLFSRWALGRMGVVLQPLPAFREWRLPPWAAWVLVACTLLLAGPPPQPATPAAPPASAETALTTSATSASTAPAPPALLALVTEVTTAASAPSTASTTATTSGTSAAQPPRSLQEALHLNVVLLMYYVFGILGLAAVADWLHRRKVAAPLRILGYFYLIASPLAMFTIMLGLADTLFALRDPEVMKEQEERERKAEQEKKDAATGAAGAGRDETSGGAAALSTPTSSNQPTPGRRSKKRSKR